MKYHTYWYMDLFQRILSCDLSVEEESIRAGKIADNMYWNIRIELGPVRYWTTNKIRIPGEKP